MVDRSATALLGMDGFVVLAHTEEDGELFVLVETDELVVGCPDCGVRATGHGRSVVQVRDVPVAGRACRLVWRKRRWRCTDPDCSRGTFTERHALVEGSLTTRAAREICRLVGAEGRSVASVARQLWPRWPGNFRDHTTMRAGGADRDSLEIQRLRRWRVPVVTGRAEPISAMPARVRPKPNSGGEM